MKIYLSHAFHNFHSFCFDVLGTKAETPRVLERKADTYRKNENVFNSWFGALEVWDAKSRLKRIPKRWVKVKSWKLLYKTTRTHCSWSEQEGGHPVKSRIPRIWLVFNWRKGTDPTCKLWKKALIFGHVALEQSWKYSEEVCNFVGLAVRKSPRWLATRTEAPLGEAGGSTGQQEQLNDQKLQIWIIDRSWPHGSLHIKVLSLL